MRIAFALTIFSTLMLGCGADDGDATTQAGSSGADSGTDGTTMSPTTTSTASSTDATMTTNGMTSSSTTDAETTDTPSDSSVGDPTTGITTGTDSGESGPSETTGAPSDPCAAAADDTDCDSCVKEMCCAQLTACADDAECVCFQDCAASMEPSLQIPMICADMCGVDGPFAHPTIGAVLSCTSNNCLLVCLPG